MSASHADLEIKGLHQAYHLRHPVLEGLDTGIRRGEFVCLLGPNGSGKSTLLKTILGLLKPSKGKILLNGEDLTRMSPLVRARQVAAVLTDSTQTEHMEVIDLVSLGRFPHSKKGDSVQDESICREALDSMGASHLAHRKVDALSDGERQRVFMARALAQDPNLLILDEPMSFLDFPQRIETFLLLRKWSSSKQRMVLMATHDLELCVHLADRLVLIEGPDRMVTGPPEGLILSGHLQKVFHSKNLKFNAREGRVEILRTCKRGKISLEGEPESLGWTRHALERLGWQVMEGSQLVVRAEKRKWLLKSGPEERSFQELAELLEYLETHKAP
jgi:iron complex transport system ATP-binding protein